MNSMVIFCYGIRTYGLNEGINNSMKDYSFTQSNNSIVMERIKLVSYMLILTYPLFFVVDFFLLKEVNNPEFHQNIIAIHLFGLVISLIYVLLYKYLVRKIHSFIIYIYISMYLFIGVAGSLNSQLLTGNIVAYSIILIGIAVIFPMKPKNIGLIILCFHLVFVSGLSFLDSEPFSLLMKQINSTGIMVIAFSISYAFYSNRKKDYTNHCKLKANEGNFRRLFNMNPSPLMLLNIENNNIELLNKQAIEYFQLKEKEISTIDGSFIFNNNDEKVGILNRLRDKQTIENFVIQQQIGTDLTRWAMLNFELFDYLDNSCLLIGMTDITNLKEAEKELFKHATLDVLTGVMNRRAGLDLLKHHLKKEEFILCFIDINHLKKVNDHKGHTAGDELIKTVCEVINNKIDFNDILFRLGGDEFVLIFLHKTVDEVEQVWHTIEQELEAISNSPKTQYPISASHGLYHYYPDNPVTVEEMIEMADMEMYKEKFEYKAQLHKRNKEEGLAKR